MPFLGPAKPAKLAVKHELEKPDFFITILGSLSSFYQVNKKNVLSALCSIIVIFGIYFAYSYFVGMRDVNASFAEYEASKIFREDAPVGANPTKTKNTSLSDKYKAALVAYQHIVDEYGQTPSGRRAAIGVANCYFNLEKYEDAVKIYKNFISMFPDSDIAYIINRNIALCYEAEGKTKEAINTLESFAQKSFVGKMLYWDIGRIYEKNNELKKAIDAYKSFKVFANNPKFSDNAALGDDADKKIESIELKISSTS